MLRTVHLLRLKPSAMSWDEDFVRLACQEFLVEVAIFSHCATCRSDEEPWNKDWKFVSNVSGFSHASLITDILHLLENGNSDGSFKSHNTSEYPEKLSDQIRKCLHVEQMRSDVHGLWGWNSVLDLVPDSFTSRMEVV